LLLKEGDIITDVGGGDGLVTWMGRLDPMLAEQIIESCYEEREGTTWVHATGTPSHPTQLEWVPVSILPSLSPLYANRPTRLNGVKNTPYEITLSRRPGIPVVIKGTEAGGWLSSLTIQPPLNRSVIVGVNEALYSVMIVCVEGDYPSLVVSPGVPMRVDLKHRFRHKKVLVRSVADDSLVGAVIRGTVCMRSRCIPVEYYFTSS
jgi:hypothetical protein